jgi:hypothetical protein
MHRSAIDPAPGKQASLACTYLLHLLLLLQLQPLGWWSMGTLQASLFAGSVLGQLLLGRCGRLIRAAAAAGKQQQVSHLIVKAGAATAGKTESRIEPHQSRAD